MPAIGSANRLHARLAAGIQQFGGGSAGSFRAKHSVANAVASSLALDLLEHGHLSHLPAWATLFMDAHGDGQLLFLSAESFAWP